MKRIGMNTAGAFMEQLDPFLDAAKPHVDLVAGALQLEDRRLPPLVEQQIARIEKPGDPHADQQQRDR